MTHLSQVDSCYRGRCGALRRYLEQHFVSWARIATETRQVPHGLRRTGNTARIKKAFEHNLLSPVYTRSCNDMRRVNTWTVYFVLLFFSPSLSFAGRLQRRANGRAISRPSIKFCYKGRCGALSGCIDLGLKRCIATEYEKDFHVEVLYNRCSEM